MSRLEYLQSAIKESLLGNSEAATALILPGGSLSAEAALAVYATGYEARLTEALGDIYETIWRVLGDDLFFSECSAYIESNPSRTHNLSHYGENFADFLAPRFMDHPFLKDVAQLEWQIARLFHQKESKAKEIDAGVAASEGEISFSFHSHWFLLESAYPIYSIWSARADSDALALALEQDRSERLFVYKKDNTIYLKTLTTPQALILKALTEGSTLTTALSAQQNTNTDDVSELFSLISNSAIIKNIQVSSRRMTWVQNIS
ncbi:MAG: DNA-binding domain-containing protein [Spirochaetia bacterium]|nr:DNA-binding domain-containing protein [Spirochaetia bacterium]